MGYRRGKFGIEFQSLDRRRENPWLGLAIVLAVSVAAVSLAVRTYRRIVAVSAAPVEAEVVLPAPTTPGDEKAAEPENPSPVIRVSGAERRPEVRNLLARLRVAEAKQDVEMAVSTIERLRSLPGNPVADLDDSLAQRLGALNCQRLFGLMSPQWVKEITVKRGDNATRLARTHGTTLAAIAKLNGDVTSLRIGQKLKVMDHPHFSLAVYRMTKVADLSLNGKFFKRYYLTGPVKGEVGALETPAALRPFLKEQGIQLPLAELVELEMLLPPGSPVVISEFR